MESPHFRVLKQTEHLLSSQSPDVLQVYSDVEKNERCGKGVGFCVFA